MSIALIKKINENTPYILKKPFSRMIRNRLINNKIFLETYSLLVDYENKSTKERNDYQLEALKRVLIHAYEHTKYYHELFDEIEFNPQNIRNLSDLQKIPPITKNELKNHFEEISADDITDFYLVTTGGSTGEPTKILMEKDAIYKEWAFVYHYWSKVGYDFKQSKLATFRGVDLGSKYYEINPLYNEIRMNPFLLNEDNFNNYLHRINSFKADYIYGYPSSIYNFCRIAKKLNVNLKERFNGALLISENLYDFQEIMIEEILKCPIAIFYGHSERAIFGEKYTKGYIFNDLYGIVEISADGEPIVTGFINGKTPLIRYVLDDTVEKIEMDEYDIKGHRTCDVIYGQKGEEVSIAALNFHDDTFDNIGGYQFIQDKIGFCTLNIVRNEKSLPLDITKIQKRVQSKIGNGIICIVQECESLEVTSRGKYRMLIQNIIKESIS